MNRSGNPPLRALVVDDSAAFRDAVAAMLRSGGIEVVGFATTAAEAVRSYLDLRPDMTLVDVDLGAESGFDVVEELHRKCAPVTAIILTSTHAEADLADLIATSPALGFLPKFALSHTAIREMISG